MSNKKVLEDVERGFRHDKPYDCPDDLYEWMLKCWNKDPADRPTFKLLAATFDETSWYK